MIFQAASNLFLIIVNMSATTLTFVTVATNWLLDPFAVSLLDHHIH